VPADPVSARPVPPELLQSFRDSFECWNRHEFEEMAEAYREDGVYDPSAVFIGESPVDRTVAFLYSLDPEGLIATARLFDDTDAALAAAADSAGR
jgi:hypothetical protein